MTNELPNELKAAGFPHITRWEVENNYVRSHSANGSETMPPSGALLSEISTDDGSVILVKGRGEFAACLDESVWIREKKYADTEVNRENGYAGKTYHSGYIDTGNTVFQVGDTPEAAVARLWLSMNGE